MQVWSYESFEQRPRARAAATKLDGWPPNTREFVVEHQRDICLPVPFSPSLEPRQLGNVLRSACKPLAPQMRRLPKAIIRSSCS
jgi:hypothetical protein